MTHKAPPSPFSKKLKSLSKAQRLRWRKRYDAAQKRSALNVTRSRKHGRANRVPR